MLHDSFIIQKIVLHVGYKKMFIEKTGQDWSRLVIDVFFCPSYILLKQYSHNVNQHSCHTAFCETNRFPLFSSSMAGRCFESGFLDVVLYGSPWHPSHAFSPLTRDLQGLFPTASVGPAVNGASLCLLFVQDLLLSPSVG